MSNSPSVEIKVSVTVAFFEFLIASSNTQKNFVYSILSSFDFCNEIKRNLQHLRDLNKENIEVTPLSMLFHILSLYEHLIAEPKKYSGLTDKMFHDTSLLNSTIETVQSLLYVKKDPQGFDLCLFIHSYAAIFRILTSYLQQKIMSGVIESIFSPETLENFLQLSARVLSSESTLIRLQDLDLQLAKQGCPAGVSEFSILQSHKDSA